MEIYLKVKKQRHASDIVIGIQTEKDMAINAILLDFNLDARQNQLALMCWREMYFMRYKSKQKVHIIE